MSKPKKIWKWKHDRTPVKVVEETADTIYYEVTVIKWYTKDYFIKELP